MSTGVRRPLIHSRIAGVNGARSIAARSALFGVLTPPTLAGTGVFMILVARGWDRPLPSAVELYRYGRPANATVVAGLRA